MTIVGITGKAHAGKDTLGQVFVEAGFKRIAFADALKEAVAVIAGEPSHLFFTELGKFDVSPVLDTTRREALQRFGKAARDALDDGIWVRRALADWERLGRPHLVITDVRYDNEAEILRQHGALIVKVERPDDDYLRGSAAEHESERGIRADLIDVEIVNDGTISELRAEGQKVLGLRGDYFVGRQA